MLDDLLPTPRLVGIEHVEVAASPAQVWQRVRHGDLAPTPLIRALFALRGLPARLRGKPVETAIRLDDMRSSPARPGFQLLAEAAPREMAVGAIGKVWRPDIPFVHVETCDEFRSFDRPDYVKVAWSIRVLPWGERDSRVEFELRVDATDDEAWRKFRRYFRVIGPASVFIRRSFLAALARELGTPEAAESSRPPDRIWPWLLQIARGIRRGSRNARGHQTSFRA